jgi:cytoskeleton protein RodZ
VTEDAFDAAADQDELSSPGARLRAARESRGHSIEEVAYALKLTPKQVAAIEQDSFELLPGATFARGFVRNYARIMSLDAAPLLAALEHRMSHGQVDLAPLSNAAGTLPASAATRGVPRLLLVLLLVVAIALVVAVFFDRSNTASLTSWRPGAVTGPATAPVVSAVTIAPENPATAPASPAPAAADTTAHADAAQPPKLTAVPAAPPAPLVEQAAPAMTPAVPAAGAAEAGARTLSFRFAKESWLEVRDASGKLLVSKLNKPDSSLSVSGRPPFALVIGNARAVQLEYDGKAVDLKPHTAVSIARFKLD